MGRRFFSLSLLVLALAVLPAWLLTYSSPSLALLSPTALLPTGLRQAASYSLPSSFSAAPERLRLPALKLPSWEAQDEMELRILSTDDRAPCQVFASPLLPLAPRVTLFALLKPAHSPSLPLPLPVLDAYFQALAAEDEASFLAALRSARHPLLQLTEAAALLGALLEGPTAVSSDPAAAQAILAGLEAQEPRNSAYSLLRALAFHQMDREASASLELSRAFAGDVIHTYEEELAQSVFLLASGHASLVPVALSLGEKLPAIDFFPLVDLYRDRLAQSDSIARPYSGFAFGKSVQERERAASGRMELLFWSDQNYRLGQRFAEAAWRKLHPGQPFPESLALSHSALLDKNSLSRPPLFLSPTEEPMETCQREFPAYAAALSVELSK
ncbi:MAG TPA: hypothetical protein VIH99_10865 [Bdellovibrionota bacterium]|jgi:hypothetical protein